MTAVSLAVSIASIVLLYLVAARMLSSARFGVAAVAIFTLTPLLWQQSQPAPASLSPLLFVIGWLWAVSYLAEDRAFWWPAALGAILGAGVYTSNAAAVMMPLYLLLTIAVAGYIGAVSWRQLGVVAGVFVVAVAPMAVSFIRHPDGFRSIVNAHHIYDANLFNPRQGVREIVSWVGLTARSEVYYDYFNPAFLFLTGRVLLMPLAVLIPAGFVQMVSHERTLLTRVSIAGFLAAPFAASLTADAPTPARILFITPFAAIVSAYGLKWLLAWRHWTRTFTS